MDPLLAYTLATMHLSFLSIPIGSGKTILEPTSTPYSIATPHLGAEICVLEQPAPRANPRGYIVTQTSSGPIYIVGCIIPLTTHIIPKGLGICVWDLV